MLTTTLGTIWSHNPCGKYSNGHGWGLLTKNLGTDDHNAKVTLTQILESNGIQDVIWALRCFDYKDYCLFLADIAEKVLPIYEAEYDNPAPRNCIKAIRDYHSGEITLKQLKRSSNAAYAANADTAADTARALQAAAESDAYAAGYAVVATDAVAVVAARLPWQEIEELLIKHFGE